MGQGQAEPDLPPLALSDAGSCHRTPPMLINCTAVGRGTPTPQSCMP
jgi:hypothetical protein